MFVRNILTTKAVCSDSRDHCCSERRIRPGLCPSFVHGPSYSLCPSVPPALGPRPSSRLPGRRRCSPSTGRACTGRTLTLQLMGLGLAERDWLSGTVSAQTCVLGRGLGRYRPEWLHFWTEFKSVPLSVFILFIISF